MSATSNDSTTVTDVGQHRTEIDWDRREPVSFAVQTLLGEVEDSPATDLDPLADYVDPDALEAFFAHDGDEDAPRSLTFEYDGYTVHVDGTGHVAVE
jgi:hypothetical protein